MTDSFTNRKGTTYVFKRALGDGQTIVQTVSKGSWHALRRKVAQLGTEQKTNDSRASKSLEHSDEWFEQWQADNENNLIDLGEKWWK